MFNNAVDDSTTSCVNLSDSPARVTCLVNHVYGGADFAVDRNNLLDCSCVAEKYDMPRLQRAVNTFLHQLKLTPSNIPHYLAIANDSPGRCELKERCIEYAASRLQHILDFRCCVILQCMHSMLNLVTSRVSTML